MMIQSFLSIKHSQILRGIHLKKCREKTVRIMQGEDTDMNLNSSKLIRNFRQGTPVNEEVLNYKKDGTPFWNELVIQPIVEWKRRNSFQASFILDVTNRKKDESLLKLQKQIFIGINEGEELRIVIAKNL